ncbi:MAG: energy-coupling factor transporter transmembrane protein EcfT [Clostridia bacterium]|nr:energy-coupling factor transporter transmembrane protein EcfT [Clostridia bacterium]
MSSPVSYISRDSIIHDLHPLTKMIASLWFLTLGIILNKPVYLAAILALILVCGFAASISREIFKSLKSITVFAFIIFLIQIIFYRSGEVAFYIIPGANLLPATLEGINFGISIALRMMIILLSFVILLSTTQVRDMMMVLVEKLKIPYDYAFMFVTALRFIPTFLGEVAKIQEAQRTRGYKVDGINPIKKIYSYVPIALPLVMMSLSKGELLALAMETRAYGIQNRRTYLKEWRMGRMDLILIIGMFLLIVLSIRLV